MCCDHAPADVKPGWSLGSDRGVWKQASATALGRSRSGYGWGRRRRRRFSEANGRHVRRIVGYGLSVYRVDLELLNRLAPNRHRHVDPVRRVRRQAEGCRASGARPREFAYCHRVARTLALRASCETRDRPSFPCRRRRGEGRSAGGMQHSQDGSDRAREAGDTGVHGACLPVMRASAREERWRISFTSRSSLWLFSIHSR